MLVVVALHMHWMMLVCAHPQKPQIDFFYSCFVTLWCFCAHPLLWHVLGIVADWLSWAACGVLVHIPSYGMFLALWKIGCLGQYSLQHVFLMCFMSLPRLSCKMDLIPIQPTKSPQDTSCSWYLTPISEWLACLQLHLCQWHALVHVLDIWEYTKTKDYAMSLQHCLNDNLWSDRF